MMTSDEKTGRARQKIWVFQENGSAESKIAGVRQFGGDRFSLEVISIDEALPPVIDDGETYLPREIRADLVLDYFRHPDLSYDLGRLCSAAGVPVAASGKKHRMEGVFTPPTCCGLPRRPGLGLYGEMFGSPELSVVVENGLVADIVVVRGAPCGATWRAVRRINGRPVEEAALRLGLEVQYFCTANPAGWDPIHGKSPVHFAGEVHASALRSAMGAKGSGLRI